MVDYTIAVMPESDISISGGVILDGVTQGDGSHLLGAFMTLGTDPLTILNITDAGADANFDDNDGNQRLDGAQTLGGVTYSNNTRIEAEYQFTLLDSTTGNTYQVVGINIRNSSPAYGTIEGLAFLGAMPPTGVALEVITTAEGPGTFGQPSAPADDYAICFTAGTRILTPIGYHPIESLTPLDMVTTSETAQRVRWIGRRKLNASDLSASPKLRPVRITEGALGNGLPTRDLLVSRQHRMLLRSKIAERMFGETEVLVPAIKLIALPGIFVDEDIKQVEYIHLLFDKHEIIFADGAPSESLFTGPEALRAVGKEAREEVLALFPKVAELNYSWAPARFIPSGRQQKQLVARHLKNQKELVD